MPIRFLCSNCGHRLSVAERLAGNRLDCPHCNQSVVVPPLPDPPQPAPKPPAEDEPRIAAADPNTFSGIELIYDTAKGDRSRPPPPTIADVIVIPRYVLYVQGGLLAAVALVAFAIGVAMGFSLAPQPPPSEQAYQISGSVTHLSGPRQLPDADAVVIMLPQKPTPPARKIPLAGLSPSDPAPEEDSKSLSLLRTLGGAYARTDASGRFQLAVPRRGRYVVVILSQRRLSGAAREPAAADIALLTPFFSRPAALLAGHHYKVLQEVISQNEELAISLD